jgi:hypothetical protein
MTQAGWANLSLRHIYKSQNLPYLHFFSPNEINLVLIQDPYYSKFQIRNNNFFLFFIFYYFFIDANYFNNFFSLLILRFHLIELNKQFLIHF